MQQNPLNSLQNIGSYTSLGFKSTASDSRFTLYRNSWNCPLSNGFQFDSPMVFSSTCQVVIRHRISETRKCTSVGKGLELSSLLWKVSMNIFWASFLHIFLMLPASLSNATQFSRRKNKTTFWTPQKWRFGLEDGQCSFSIYIGDILGSQPYQFSTRFWAPNNTRTSQHAPRPQTNAMGAPPLEMDALKGATKQTLEGSNSTTWRVGVYLCIHTYNIICILCE